jgi:hypothetical protein
MFILDKVVFKLILVKWGKEGHFLLIKGSIYQEEITIINFYAPYVNTNFTKHKLKDLKAHIVPNTVMLGDFNTPLSPIDRSFRQKNQ